MTTCLATYFAEKRSTRTHHGHLRRGWTMRACCATSGESCCDATKVSTAVEAREAASWEGTRRAKGQVGLGGGVVG